jgi:PTS system fructose-specific IIA component
MPVSEIIDPASIVLDLPASNKAEVLDFLAELLYGNGVVSSKEIFKADVLLRESEGKTGIGGGVAIPHGKSEAVLRTCITVARLKDPVQWESVDGEPVALVILFAVRRDDKNDYFVKLMSQVARMLARERFCEALLAAESERELLDLFMENEERK